MATAVSRTGDGMTQVALPLLVAHLTGDVRQLAGVYAMLHVAYLGLPLYAGVITDRVDRRRLLLVCDLGRALLVGLTAIAVVTDTIRLPMVYGLALALGVGEVFFRNAAINIVPSVVTEEQYDRANGRLSAIDVACAELGGPALGALLFALAAEVPFMVDSVSFLFAASCIWLIRRSFRAVEEQPVTHTTSVRSDLATGLRWLWRHPTLRSLSLLAGSMNLGLQVAWAPLLVFAERALGLDDWGFGLMLSGLTVGSIIGGLIADRVTSRLGPGATVRVAVTLQGGALLVCAAMTNAVAAIAVLSFVGLGQVLFSVVSVSTRQAAVPDHLRGRVAGAAMVLTFAGLPAGAVIGGLVAHAYGPRAPLVASASICFVAMTALSRSLTDRSLTSARRRIDLTDSALAAR